MTGTQFVFRRIHGLLSLAAGLMFVAGCTDNLFAGVASSATQTFASTLASAIATAIANAIVARGATAG